MRRSILASSRRRPLTLPGGLILIALGPIDGWERPAEFNPVDFTAGKGKEAGGGNKRRGDVCHFLSPP